MSNLNQNNFHDYWLLVNNDEFWDLFLCKDRDFQIGSLGKHIVEECLYSYIDMSDPDCTYENGWVYSKPGYSWSGAIAKETTLKEISYVGFDNGLFLFRKDRITNKDFTELFGSQTYRIIQDDLRLKLHPVSGCTLKYEYPMSFEDGAVKLNGGFLQGFFKTKCGEYEVLPSRFEDGETIHLEFTLNKCDLEKESSKTLNDKYPENNGIFFYIGTRAENKFVYLYDKSDEDGLEECATNDIGNYVDGADIEKDSYIIGNFSGDMLEFPREQGWFYFQNYTDFYYEEYDEGYDPQDDYFDFEDNYIVQEKIPSFSGYIDDCYCGANSNEIVTYLPFFRGCACPIIYKKKVTKKEFDGNDPNEIFGEDYISDFDAFDTCETEYIEPELDITDFEYYTENGLPLSEANQYYFYTDNKFLMFDRTKDGMTVNNWVDGTVYMYHGRRSQFKGNLFIYMNRTKTGYTIHNIDELIDKDANEYNPYTSLYNNAFALRIKEDGSIGYRMLVKDCEKEGRDKTSIIEDYSYPGVISDCEWNTVNVRIDFHGKTMSLMFYVNGKLVYITKEIPKLDLRELNDLYEKQEGVPYNISIGGGTQGLAETIQYNYMLNPSRVYPLERFFAGSFIGYLRSFRFYGCKMEQNIIENNYQIDA